MKFNILSILLACFFCLAANNCCVSSDNDKLAHELKNIENNIPLPYHDGLDTTMRRIANKPMSNQFLTQSAIIDSALVERGMPLELRYLPLALSGMYCDYRQDDRCGVWQLPTLVGMYYGLTIDSNRDERLETKAATEAALNYLNDLHNKYNDWWYSILAYTNSPVSLNQALLQHNETSQIWDFSEQKLVPNTAIIADFIACVYLGDQNRLNFVETSKPMANFISKPIENQSNTIDNPTKEPAEQTTNTSNNKETDLGTENSGTIKYKIKRGDTLTRIAKKHNVTISDLKKWNNLKSDKILIDETLIIKK